MTRARVVVLLFTPVLREAVFKGLRDDLPAVKSPTTPTRAHRAGKGRGGVPRENILQLTAMVD
jgi:hypothetical protein